MMYRKYVPRFVQLVSKGIGRDVWAVVIRRKTREKGRVDGDGQSQCSCRK
jgi:hypothetical protein